MSLNYYISILYARKNPDGTIPEGFDMEFPDSKGFVGKRVTYPRYSDQIIPSKKKFISSSNGYSPFRHDIKMVQDTYEISKKTFDEMEEKPPIEEMSLDGKTKVYGWTEKNHQDEYSEIRKYIIKGYKPT